MSRQYTAQVGERITCSIGGLVTNDAGPSTFIFLWRPLALIPMGLIRAFDAGAAQTWGINPFSDGRIYFGANGFTSTDVTYTATDGWRIDVFRKPAGNAQVVWSKYLYSGGGWSHSARGNVGDEAVHVPPASLILGAFNNAEALNGRLAAVAVWNSVLTDANIDSSGIESALFNWMNLSPDAAWKFNVDDVVSGAVDLTGNGANETSHSATSFSTDEPAGFDFSLVSTVTGTGVADLGALSAAASGGVIHPGVAVADLGALSAAASGNVTVVGAALSDLGRLVGSADVVPPDPDMFVSVLMNELLACLCENAAAQPNPPGICCFRVGTEIAHDAGILEDQCCEGIGYVALGDSFFSSESFPEADIVRQANSSCAPTSYAQEFQVGLIRCAPVGNEFRGPNCTEWNDASRQNVVDAQTLRRVACCIRNFIITNNDLFLGMSIVIDRQIQGNPQGGCVERSMKITIQFPNCEC